MSEPEPDDRDPGVNKPSEGGERPHRRPIGLSEMADTILDEWIRRKQTARAINKAFGHDIPESEQRRMEVFEATYKFLDRLAPVLPEVRRLITPPRRQKD